MLSTGPIIANHSLTIPRQRQWLNQADIDANCRRYPVAKLRDSRGRVELFKVDAAGLLYAGRRVASPEPASIAEPPDPREIVAVLAVLRAFPPTVVSQPTTDSYYLKHRIENAVGEYVSNGALIVAMSRAGIPQRQIRLNTDCQVSKRWVSELQKLSRGAWAHLISSSERAVS